VSLKERKIRLLSDLLATLDYGTVEWFRVYFLLDRARSS
jgi:hypothetical protein